MKRKIIVVAHNLRSCHNIGSLFRTCEGIGVERLILSGYTPYPLNKNDQRLPHIAKKIDRQIEKTALGAQLSQSWQSIEDVNEVLDILAADDYAVCSLEQSTGSIPVNEFKPPGKIALFIGNEVNGLDRSILDNSSYILEIPMFGRKESFNVVQAAAMALYAFRFSPY